MKLTTHLNGVTSKTKNKRIAIFEKKVDDKTIHCIEVKSLTKDSGSEIGAISLISKNGKIKFSAIGFKEEALMELHYCLSQYLINKRKHEIKTNLK
jgi:hypothetical protein